MVMVKEIDFQGAFIGIDSNPLFEYSIVTKHFIQSSLLTQEIFHLPQRLKEIKFICLSKVPNERGGTANVKTFLDIPSISKL